MAKRFIDTTLWTQNKWFRKLSIKDKLFWIYLICNCDSVGVWEEDFELTSFVIGEFFTKDEINGSFENRIKWFNDKKLWIVDFCNFQYGTLKEENLTNKPHQSYINLLKKHRLWIDYGKTLQSLKEKEKEKDKDIDIDKDKELFDVFRKNYPGTKNGLKYEFENFRKHHKDWKEILPVLDQRLNYQKEARQIRSENKLFVPPWKNLQTWINQRCWEEQINTEV